MVVEAIKENGDKVSFDGGYLIYYPHSKEDKIIWNFITKRKGRSGVVKFLRRLNRSNRKHQRIISCWTGKEVSEDKINRWMLVGKAPEKEVLMLDN